MYVNGSYVRPLQGMSQQPQDVRTEGQCTMQVNMQPNVVAGLTKRIGTHYVQRLPHAIPEKSCIHFYNRGDEERYWIVLEPNGVLRVYDAMGVPYNVIGADTHPASLEYLKSNDPVNEISFQTIADFTFICNKKKIPAWDAGVESPLPNIALVPVLYCAFGKTYTIRVNDQVVASYAAPDGATASDASKVDTTFVAGELAKQIKGAANIQESHRFYRETKYSMYIQGVDPNRFLYATVPNIHGTLDTMYARVISGDRIYLTYTLDNTFLVGDNAVVYLRGVDSGLACHTIENTLVISNAGNSFTISTSDGANGKDMPAIYHQAAEISELPTYAPVGYKVQILGKGKSKEEHFWLEAVRGNAGSQKVSWQESRAPNEVFRINPYTMPQALVREFDGSGNKYFSLQPVDWKTRDVGGESNNPAPSFITDGAPINSIGVFQNRLFFLAGESFVASQSNEFFNLFKTTTQTEEEDRPIDKYADTEEVNLLQNYASLDGDLVLFSQGAQFVIKGDKAVTADNMNMRLTTQYSNNAHIKPATTGETTIFSYNIGRFVQLREFFTDSYTDTKKARPITEHVDQLIEGNVIQMIGSTNLNTVIVRTDKNPNLMYMYDYLWQGADKVQSAWWIYSVRETDKIVHVVFDRSIARFIMYRDGYGYTLEEYDVGDPNDEGLNFSPRLDAKVQIQVTRSPNLPQRWVAHIPQYLQGESEIDVILGEGVYPLERGNTNLAIKDDDGNFIIDPADLAEEGVNSVKGWVGIPYTAVYIPTAPIIKDDNNSAYGLDRLTVNTIYVNYTDTGAFKATVQNKNGVKYQYEYSGRVMGRLGNIVGFAKLDEGQFPVPIRDKNTNTELTLWSDSYLPFAIRNLEWKGMINLRGKRV